MPCFIMTSLCGIVLVAILICQYIIPLNTSYINKIALGIFFAFCAISPIMIPLSENMVSDKIYPYFHHTLLFLFIMVIIIFNYTFIADILVSCGHFIRPSLIPSIVNRNFINKVNAVCLGMAFFSSLFSLYSGMSVPSVKEITIKNPKITEQTNMVVLSDLHFNRVVNPDKIKGIVEKTNSLKPDVVVLDGDIIDDNVKNITEHLEELKKLSAEKVVYVSGNHEMYKGYKQSVDAIRNIGITVLENNGFLFKNNIFIGGIPDPGKFNRSKNLISSPDAAMSEAKNDNFRILLSHSPKDFPETDFDMEISGHTHGGQIFPFHFFVKAANKYVAGLYNINSDKLLYITRGSGQWGPQMRFLAPSEITLMHLTK